MSYSCKSINAVIILLQCLNVHTHVDGCIVSDEVVHATPNVQQAQLLFVNVMHSQLVNSLLDDTPYLVVN